MLSLIIPSMKMSTLEEKRWYHILTICVLMHLAFLMKHAVQQHRNWCQLVFGTFVAAAQDGIRIVRSGWERWLFDNLSLAWKLVPVGFLFSWDHNSWSQAKAASATENCFYFSNLRSLVYSIQEFLIWVICVLALKGFGYRTIVYQHNGYKYWLTHSADMC